MPHPATTRGAVGEPLIPADGKSRRARSAKGRGSALRSPGLKPHSDCSSAETIGEVIARRAREHPAALALVDVDSQSVTLAEVGASIAAMAARLAHAGLAREDRVGVFVEPGVTGAHLVLALASNVAVVPVNPALTPSEVLEICAVSGLKALVIPQGLEAKARLALGQLGAAAFEAIPAPDGFELAPLAAGRAAPLAAQRAGRPDDVALLLRSSGSTGAPKLIPVTHRNLIAMAERMGSARWFGLSAADRAPCTLPLYYAAGLKTSLFVPLLLGATVGFPPARHALDLARWIGVLQPTFLSVAPGPLNGMLDRLRHAPRLRSHSLRFVMSAAAYLPERVRLEAESLLGVPVLEYYALSEAGVVAANPAPPGAAKPGTVGRPVPGELVLVDEDKRPVARGAVGQIMIRGPTVTPGYVLADGSKASEASDDWLSTGDLGRLDEEGYLSLVGRVKEVINRGGEKVFPYEVEKALLEHPGVFEAAVFGVPHPRLGEQVAAAVVLKRDGSVTEHELKQFLAGRLAAYKLPRRLSIVPSLPRGPTGKVLRAPLREAAAAPTNHVPPHHIFEFELRDLWRRLLQKDDIGIDEDFLELGGDSLLATEMLLEVEALTGRPYPESELATLTIRRIADVVRSGMVSEPALMTKVTDGGGIPFFFCHGDYLTRGIYARKLAALLPEDVDVFLLHCRAGSDVEELAAAYAEEVLRVAPGSPVFIGGYCNGGLAAWHLAYLLRARGVPVAQLLLVDTMSLNARRPLNALPRLFHRAGAVVPGTPGRFLREDAMRVVWNHQRGFISLPGLLLTGAQRLVGPEPQRDPHKLSDRTYLTLMSRYAPPPIDTAVTCFIAEDGRHSDTDPERWRRLAPQVNVVRVPGTHLTAITAERAALAGALGRVLSANQGAIYSTIVE